MQAKIRRVEENKINPTGTTNAFGVSGGVNLIKDYNKWVIFKIEGDKVTARIAEKDRANRKEAAFVIRQQS